MKDDPFDRDNIIREAPSGIYDGLDRAVGRPDSPPSLADLIADHPQVSEALIESGLMLNLTSAARSVGLATAGLSIELPPEVITQLKELVLAEIRSELLAASTDESEYMRVEEAAVFIRNTPDRVRKLRSRGVLTKYGDGGNALIKRSELEAWIKNEPNRGRTD